MSTIERNQSHSQRNYGGVLDVFVGIELVIEAGGCGQCAVQISCVTMFSEALRQTNKIWNERLPCIEEIDNGVAL